METTELPPNQELLKAREKLGWTIASVANDLKLSVAVISALENGRYDELHGDAFVMGSLRSYSKLLGLDSDSIIRAYRLSQQKNIPQEVEVEVQSKRVAFRGQSAHKKYRTGYGIAAAIALLVVLGVSLPAKIPHPQEVSQTITVDTAVGTTVISSVDALPDENPTHDVLPVVESTIVDDATDTSSISPVSDSNIKAMESVEAGKSSLRFVFSADCWVEVLDGDNQKIVSSLQRANDHLELVGKPPFKITLGYAPGVAISYNSHPVNIDNTSENIAKLVVGNS